jgi:acyl carrier protein
MIPDERTAEVVSRLTGVQKDEFKLGIPPKLPLLDSVDSLDTTELIVELEEESDKMTV